MEILYMCVHMYITIFIEVVTEIARFKPVLRH